MQVRAHSFTVNTLPQTPYHTESVTLASHAPSSLPPLVIIKTVMELRETDFRSTHDLVLTFHTCSRMPSLVTLL